MIDAPSGKALVRFLYRPRHMTFHGFEGENLAIHVCAGCQLVSVTALCWVSHEAFAHESRREGDSRGIMPELFHDICFRLLHFHYPKPVGYD